LPPEPNADDFVRQAQISSINTRQANQTGRLLVVPPFRLPERATPLSSPNAAGEQLGEPFRRRGRPRHGGRLVVEVVWEGWKEDERRKGCSQRIRY
jgi:hypothetical protein